MNNYKLVILESKPEGSGEDDCYPTTAKFVTEAAAVWKIKVIEIKDTSCIGQLRVDGPRSVFCLRACVKEKPSDVVTIEVTEIKVVCCLKARIYHLEGTPDVQKNLLAPRPKLSHCV